ncbi:MAG: hypothetical protein GY757_34260 [bacterium]|nr:hypothetical protein [bacterium]
MKKMIIFILIIMGCLSLLTAGTTGTAGTKYSVAILSFVERGVELEGRGAVVRDLVFSTLSKTPGIVLVERGQLDKIITETELNLSGVIAPKQAIRIGQLTGAKILITGSIFKIEENTHMVAKIISTETGRVKGCSTEGCENLEAPAVKLAEKIEKILLENTLQPAAPAAQSLNLDSLRRQLKGKRLPTAYVDISEKHIGRNAADPAAETEIIYIYKQLGGNVVDKEGDTSKTLFKIQGQGFSEFAGRTGNLVTVKARLEVKVLDNKGNVVAIDRESTVKVDLNEMIAGKAALQLAAQKIAARILPKIAAAGK